MGSLKTIYRNLRENYEYSLRYDEADKLFTKEMELRRKYEEKHHNSKYTIKRKGHKRSFISLTGLYYLISGYGQNYRRPSLLALLVISFPIIYSIAYTSINQSNFSGEIVYNATTTNLQNIFRIKEGQDIVGLLINIITIPILGTIIIAALKRTFEKRFRKT